MLNLMIGSTLIPAQFLAFFMPSGGQWIILLVLGLLIFGSRLPEVGRSLGKAIVEFKKGIRGLEDEVDEQVNKPSKKITDEARQELPNAQARERAAAEKVDETT